MEVLEKVNLTILFDIYSELLTEKQRTVFQMYINEDAGLTEIGEALGFTRQAAKDAIKSVTAQLYSLEEKLKLKAQFEQNNQMIDQILNLSSFDGKEMYIRQNLEKLKKNL